MLRLFVGIGLPPELKLGLSQLCAGVPGAKWVDPGNFHVTLRFIGEVDEGRAADIDEALAESPVPPLASSPRRRRSASSAAPPTRASCGPASRRARPSSISTTRSRAP